MSQYSVSDARRQLPELIDAAQSGEVVKLTRHGKAVAVLVSTAEFERLQRGGRSFAEVYGDWQRRFPSVEDRVPLEHWEGTKDHSPGREVDL